MILVTGATGYIGSRLTDRLLGNGRRVRVMVRDPSRLDPPPWGGQVEVAQADVLQPATLPSALAGVDTAYYLIHSMLEGDDFHRKDIQAARDFGRAAQQAGVRRIIYLGGLGDPEETLSPHLASRQQTGVALREAGVPVTEFRAAVVVGAGSLSFEMVRYLTEHIPLMICPRWVYTRIQPIAVDNCLDYLEAALDQPESAGEVIEIGGGNVLTYGEMMTGYARVRGLRRTLLPVPVLTPRLSSYWVHLVTPISADIAQPLIQGVRNEVIVRDDAAQRLFPEIQLLDYPSAVRAALEEMSPGQVPRTERPGPGRGPDRLKVTWQQGLILEHRQRTVGAAAGDAFRALNQLGGEYGWLYLDWAWRLRAAVDQLLGGIGMRRTLRGDAPLRPGDHLDFWTVEAVEPDRLLRLRADMRLPGQAWLEYEIDPISEGESVLHQWSIYEPKGLLGLLYWYAVYPFHALVARGLLRNLVRLARRLRNEPLAAIGPNS